MELATRYNPFEVEQKWYQIWMERGYFKPLPNPNLNSFTIVIPPPNVTGILHLGHALNNTIQDIFIRYKRMQGFETLWLPGVDHAGIATQVIVERELLKGSTKEEIGRDKFIALAYEWAKDKKATILEQLKELGCSCDWERTKFTLDPEMSNAVYEAFIRLYNKGWIYKGDYIVNWCPRCETAISDLEVEHQEEQGHLYYIKYPLTTGESITVATTRPETMLGDTACAINPQDTRNACYIGKTAILPFVNRPIPIIADERVDPQFGTGIVKITPAHDPIDFEIAEYHKLPKILIMDKRAIINENGGKYKGLARFDARRQVIDDLKGMGVLEKVVPYTYAVGHCHRCNTIIEPMLSTQWFVRQKELARPAISAVENNEIRFYPERWKGVYLNWMYNIKDWCISRQIWWGHRLPVFYCQDEMEQDANRRQKTEDRGQKTEKSNLGCNEIIVAKEAPVQCPKCGNKNLVQDTDVLDTWFSSWLWPISTLGWPNNRADLNRFYPTSLLSTAPEIIFFWVARMIMAGYEFMGKPPFNTVYLHGTVRDAKGIKMSRTLGNGIDPREVITKYGTDAVRFSLITTAGEGGDPHIEENTFEIGRSFTNKLWNAYRLISLLPDHNPQPPTPNPQIELADKWILSQLNRLIKEVSGLLDNYKLQEPSMRIYDFLWHKFCDWYLEILKIRNDKGVAIRVLDNTLRLLHPFVPFVTEEIWQRINPKSQILPQMRDPEKSGTNPKSIMISEWPKAEKQEIDAEAEEEFDLIQNIVIACRNTRAELNIPKLIKIIIKTELLNYKKIIEANATYIKILGKVEMIEFTDIIPTGGARIIIKGADIFIPQQNLITGIIDSNKELKKLEAEYSKVESLLQGTKSRLNSPEFLSKAPQEVIVKTQEKLNSYEQKLLKLADHIKLLNTAL
ncbi:MAG: valine--tRNA ligase [Candidatus Stahlbacteria bacterium]|nr:valine--tRNA ligase [Candidatus Stahlbacteria bacterium]